MKKFLKRINEYFGKKEICEEMELQNEWYKQAEKMQYKDLFKFIHKLMFKYKHDYGTICHAITACIIATFNALNRTSQGGITGTQASLIMWGIVRKLFNKKGILSLVEYDNMLYPQYKDNFEKTISSYTFNDLQKKAKEMLDNTIDVHPAVKEHWQKIVDGIVPFGYTIKK